MICAFLVLESIADFAYSICYTFQFSMPDMFSSVRYLPALPVDKVIAGAAYMLMALLVCVTLAFLVPRPRSGLRVASALIAVVAVLVPIDVLGGQNPLWGKDMALLAFRVARSPALTLLIREVRGGGVHGRAQGAGDAPMAAASSQAANLLASLPASSRPPNVVLVVAESWGSLLDAHLERAITAPFDDPALAGRYKTSHGTVPFTGLTVPGEARELCHSSIGFGIIDHKAGLQEKCVMSYFHARGYQNIAIHGYVGQMFHRSAWYPELGFDQTWFEPELSKAGLPRCRGAFPGICDSSIGEWIGSSLLTQDERSPRFIYWVTLNAHIPVPAHPDLPDDGACDLQPALRDSASLCSWFRLVRAVHESVRQAALRPTARPTIFIVVGDHAPPFSDPRLRGMFSSTEVPYVMLTPAALSR